MKLLIALAGFLVAVAVAGGLALATVGGSSSDTPRIDFSGPCDEAEHANDPRCTGTRANDDVGTTTGPDDVGTTTAPAGVDISGPCDEAEHANDPRCTDGARDEDGRRNRGPGGGDDEDRSGPSGDSD